MVSPPKHHRIGRLKEEEGAHETMGTGNWEILRVLTTFGITAQRGTQADHSPLLSTLPTNSTCLSQRVTRVNMGAGM